MVVGTKTVGTFCDDFGFVVETLHAAEGNLPFGLEPVEQEGPVRSEHAGNFLHGIEPGTHGSGTPLVQELAGPGGRTVAPEPLEVLLEQVGPDSLEVIGQQLGQFADLFFGQVLWPFQQTPAAPLQDRFFSVSLEFLGFFGSDFVNSFAHMAHDMETIEDIDGILGFFCDDIQVWPPHVTANKAQALAAILTEPIKKGAEGFGGAVWSDPQQAPIPSIELIDQGDKLVLSFAPADFVGADGVDIVEVSMLKPPLYRHVNRADHGVPTGMEGFGDIFPGQAFGPDGQEPGIGVGQTILSPRPRQTLHPNTTSRTIHPSGGIEEEHQDAPQGDKCVGSLRQGVVPWTFFAADGTGRPCFSPWPQGYVHSQFVALTPATGGVDKTWLFFDPIEYSLDLHPVLPPPVVSVAGKHTGTVGQDAFIARKNLKFLEHDGTAESRPSPSGARCARGLDTAAPSC